VTGVQSLVWEWYYAGLLNEHFSNYKLKCQGKVVKTTWRFPNWQTQWIT